MNRKTASTTEALAAYFKNLPGCCEPYGNGHINDTYLVIADKKYILQRMNTSVFPDPAGLMENISGVTEHIRRKSEKMGKDAARSTLTVIPTLSGECFFKDKNGDCFRMYEYVVRTVTKERVENPEDFYACVRAFGHFQQMLSDYPAEKLSEPIADFHNTPKRFENLMKAVAADPCGRLARVREEVEFVRAREDFCRTLQEAEKSGRLPLRVTHNDTKLNNILFDEVSGEPVCVIDLDTVMPGYSVNDFGDSIRFGANTAAEDETDLSRVSLDLELFSLYAKGFMERCGGSLTEEEIQLLPIGAIMMTLECGMRFLSDYLMGDTYFKIHREHHNLDRARNQFALVADMERKLPRMREIIQRLL